MTDSSAAVTVPTPDGDLPAHLWLPPAGRGPGLVLVQEIFGVSDYILARGADLAALGYVVLAPELYWRLDGATLDESRDDVLQQAMGLAQRVDWEVAVDDVRRTVDALRERSETTGRVGLVGFCWGGGLAFNVAAVSDADALVSYYGSALPQLVDLAPQVGAPSLHHFGLDDQFIPRPEIDRLQAVLGAQENVTFRTHLDAGHAFDNPNPMFYSASASAQAWSQTSEFLARELPVG